MASLLVITLQDGTLVRGLSYRMDPTVPTAPSTAQSYSGGQYHVQTSSGWVDIDGSQVRNTVILGGRAT